jgi:hypothetical protein
MPSCQSLTDEADTSSKSLNSSWWTADGHTSHRTVKTSWLLGQGIPLFMGAFLSFDLFYSITVHYNITLFRPLGICQPSTKYTYHTMWWSCDHPGIWNYISILSRTKCILR